jgi:tetratricopeptide (TPR) repeat protein
MRRKKRSTASEAALERTIVMVAAGGDASRFLLPSSLPRRVLRRKDELVAATEERSRSILTEPIRRETPERRAITLSDLIFGQIETLQRDTGLRIPTAVITGPNSHDAIASYLTRSPMPADLDLEVIRQKSNPVFSSDGRPLFWEDGAVLEAPNGTAGCLEALRASRWFQELVRRGSEFVFVWYGNDPSAGTSLARLVAELADNSEPFRWMSDHRGGEALRELVSAPFASSRPDLIEALEDAPGACAVRVSSLTELLDLVEEHVVTKSVPIPLPNGDFLAGMKRERFLADILRRTGLLEYRRNRDHYQNLGPGATIGDRLRVTAVRTTPHGALYDCVDLASGDHLTIEAGGPDPDSRGTQGLKQLAARTAAAMRSGASRIRFEVDIGERQPGELLVGSYRILEVKSGGLGLVYICEDVADGERVAIKTYKDEIRWGHPQAVRRFWHEANAWAALPAHPNIVTAQRVEEIDGRLHIVLDYIDGGDLRPRLRHAPLSTAESVKIALDVCTGLQAIHANGLVHRDIKPENILLTRVDVAKVTDLGLVMAAVDDPHHTPAAGTRGYLAPEQTATPDRITTNADIYALGVVLHEMLTGKRPAQRATAPASRIPGVPRALSALVASCLDPDAAKRPTATELAKELGGLSRALTGATHERDHEPQTAPATVPIGRINSLAALGRWHEALELCEATIRADPSDQIAAYTRALLLYDLQRYRECIQQCLEAYRLPDRGRSQIRTRLANLIDMSGIWLGVAKGDAAEWVTRGLIAATVEGHCQAGLRCADAALKLDPGHEDAWQLKGECLYSMGHYQEAIVCYERSARSTNPELRTLAERGRYRCRAILEGRALHEFRMQNALSAGQRHLEQGRPVDAEPLFRAALEASLGSRAAPLGLVNTAQLGLGISALELGRPAEAVEHFDQILQTTPKHHAAWYNRGLALQLMQRLPEAMHCYEQALESSPDYQAWNNKAACLLELGRHREARDCYQQALLLNPESEKAQLGLAESDARQRGAASQIPSAVGHWTDRGVAFLGQERLKEALDCFRNALQLEPNSAVVWYNAGYALWKMGLHNAALEHCQRALTLDPKLVHAWNIQGNALDDLGRTREALESFEQAIRLDRRYYEAWNGQGLCLRTLGQHEEAVASFREACSIEPRFGRGWFNMAATLAGMGRLSEAAACYDRSLKIDSRHPRAAAGKGQVLFYLGRYDQAVQSFRRAIETDPHDAGSWNDLGGTQVSLGHYAEAIKSFEQALEIDPHLGEARRNLDRVHQIIG